METLMTAGVASETMVPMTPPSSAALFWQRGLLWTLTALAFALPLSIAVSNILWGLALVCYLGLLGTDPSARKVRATGLEIPIFLFLLIEAVTAALSDRPGHSLGKMKSEMLWVLFFLFAQTESRPRRYLGAFVSGAAVAAGWGLLQVGLNVFFPDMDFGWKKLMLHNGRAKGFYENPITFAEVLLPAIAVLMGALRRESFTRTWKSGGLLVLLLLGVWTSGTRSVWLALPLTVGLWALVRRDKWMVAVLVLLLAGGGVFVALSPAYRARAVSVVGAGPDMGAQRSNNIRRGMWVRCVEKVRQHPWKGVGVGNLNVLGRDLPWGGAPLASRWTEAHNIYLQMAVERGVPGLLIFILLLGAMGALFWRAAGVAPASEGLFFGFVGLVLAGLTESWTNDSEVMMVLYLLLGVAAAVGRTAARDTRSPT